MGGACKVKCRLVMVFVAAIAVLISGCVTSGSRSGEVELDFDRIEVFLQERSACLGYLGSLVSPAAKAMSGIPDLADIRRWVSLNPDYELSKIALKVRVKTRKYGPLDPVREFDRAAVAVALYEVLEGREDFSPFCHDEALHEIVMNMIYVRLARKESDIGKNMMMAGFYHGMEQEWALLFTLMAADVRRSLLADPIAPEGRPCNLPAYEKRVLRVREHILEKGEFHVPSDVLGAGDGYACALVVGIISNEGVIKFAIPVVSYPSNLAFESVERALAGYRFKAPKSRYGGVWSALIIETGFNGLILVSFEWTA